MEDSKKNEKVERDIKANSFPQVVGTLFNTLMQATAPIQEAVQTPEQYDPERHIKYADIQMIQEGHQPVRHAKTKDQEDIDSAREELFEDSDGDSDSDITPVTCILMMYEIQMKRIMVPAFVAAMIQGPQGSTLCSIRMMTQCLELDMPDIKEVDSQEIMVYVNKGDKGPVNWARDIVMRMILEQTREKTDCLQPVITCRGVEARGYERGRRRIYTSLPTQRRYDEYGA